MWRIHCRPINNHTKICAVYLRPSVIYLGGHQVEKRKGPLLKDKQADKQTHQFMGLSDIKWKKMWKCRTSWVLNYGDCAQDNFGLIRNVDVCIKVFSMHECDSRNGRVY